MKEIKYIVGDATNPKGSWPLIVHVCNNVGAWGAGFVIPLGKKYPKAERGYRVLSWAMDNKLTLGYVQFIREGKVMIVNMIAQDNVISKKKKGTGIPLQYDALEECLNMVAAHCLKSAVPREVHMPRIGCGLAGGTWDKVEPIILRTLCAKGIQVTVYDLK